jgi:peptide/nickel transport system substrate-binding protein
VAPTGQITVVLHTLPAALDIHAKSGNELDQLLTGSVMEALTQRPARQPGNDPALAERWEQVDATTWRFYLRKNVRFHDGTPFNADAVVWNVEDVLRPDLNSPLLIYLSKLQGARKVDDHTVDLLTKELDPTLPLSLHRFHIFSPTHGKQSAQERARKCVGTGPYAFVEWVEGQHIKLTAFGDYWGTAPTIKDVTVVGRAEPSVRVSLLLANEAQVAVLLPPDAIKRVPRAEVSDGFDTHTIRLNALTHPALKDARVRRAISHAIDRQAIVTSLLSGVGTPASHLFSAANVGYDPELKPYAFDPAKARQLLDEARKAGVAVDTEITIHGRKGRLPFDVEIRDAIVQMLGDVGLKAKQQTMENGPWLDFWNTVDPTKTIGDAFDNAHGNDLGDAAGSYLSQVRSGTRLSTFKDEALDKQIDEAARLTGDARERAWRAVSKSVYDLAPIIPLYHVQNIFGVAPNVAFQARIDGRLYLQHIKVNR